MKDYHAFDALTNTGVAELQGKRSAQEDRVAMCLLPKFAALNHQQKITYIQQLIDQLQNSCGKTAECGSTLLAAFIANNIVYTANVGDSTAFGVVFNAHGKITEFTQINKVLHNPGVLSEKKRLAPAAVHQFSEDFARLGPSPYYSLALSRAIGDTYFEQFGLIHTPDIDIWQPQSTADKALLILACDGFTEADCLTQTDIQLLLEKHHQKPLDELAQILASTAIKQGSQDNVSVMITTLEINSAKAIALFDGHGGDKVSACLQQKFSSIAN